MTKISILGCGWLGFPLAKAMIAKDFSVKGSTTTSEKIALLEESGINPFLININLNEVNSLFGKSLSLEIDSFLNESSILIIDIPPKLRGDNTESFVDKIAFLIPFIEESTIEKVLFISSTSVYGENNVLVTEETKTNADSESGKQLAISEILLLRNTNFKTTILRFGGLIGEDRNPIKFLAGKENIENPEAPINFIHLEDCIGIILKIIESNSWDQIYNAVAPFHPSREEYYTQKAREQNLALPKFIHEKESTKKIISSAKIENVLHYTFAKKP
ncbi:SDR family NAD(P)-dependent oxidoreductase [Flavobacterium sp. ALJ2]|uniref:SDR family NAD(P)-dependent oxidoreductase n=1 Tax=Flavobacterium sp. ALJ2 TaxID=2786960 RepID=UPI0018A0CA98|nr:SDR family NAD(P)-dependent oxidoreductase [Flavobacterium sp. ALJ2]MBF7091990.1 SDR family NAD(P)-dependent oxidoreductase [Flavobacterium sp. ALJ2]